MAIVKVIELLAQSDKSWEDATQVAIDEVTRTVRNVKSIYVKDFQAVLQDDQTLQYRINAKVSFEVDDHMRHELSGHEQGEKAF